METLCDACQYPNRSGELFCSHCGKRLFDEDGSERTIDTKTASSEPGPPVSRGSGTSRPLVIGIVVIGIVVIGAVGLAVAIGMSMHESPSNGAGTVPERASQTTVATPKTIKPTPEALIGLPVHHNSYSYRGIELGEAQAKVMARLKEFGYLTWENNGLNRYTANENPEAGISRMNVLIKNGRLDELMFNFDPSYINDYLNAVTMTYGPLTYSRPVAVGHGTMTIWKTRAVEPCDAIGVTDDTDPDDATHTGGFGLAHLDSSDIDLRVTVNLCSH